MDVKPQPDTLPPWLVSVLDRSYGETDAKRYGMGREGFNAIVLAVAEKYLAASYLTDRAECEKFLTGLHVRELVLARACAAGNDAAWQDFLLQFREALYAASRSITHEESSGRELADSLYADLYGTAARDGKRVSKLDSYTGRGSLAGWLRTVLAQEHVNRYRKQRRSVSLEEKTDAGVQFAAPVPAPTALPDTRVVSAIDQALAEVEAEDRLILIHYYLEGRTLAEVGRMLGVHESTISRKTVKIVERLRRGIFSVLLKSGMSRRQVEEALDVDVRDITVDFKKSLGRDGTSAAAVDLAGSSYLAAAARAGATDIKRTPANLAQDLKAPTFQAREGEE